jgi:hypothetical protein
MKLGEMLVKVGKLTPAQVEETLKGQAIFGGRFGTNLVEMGYLDEQDLAQFLSKKTGVAAASPDQLMEIPPQVLKLIPEDMIRKYRVVPVALQNRKLVVAMTDPSDFAAIDAISFATGFIVVPVVTPELRLVTALEKHYKIRRELRYIKVDGQGRARPKAAEPSAPQPQPAKEQAAAKPAPPAPELIELDELEVLDLPLLSEWESLAELEETQPPMPAPVVQQPAVQQPQPAAVLQQVAEKEYTLQTVLQGFTQAEDRHDIGDLIVNYTAQQYHRTGMFLLKGGMASGWVAQVGRKPVAGFEKLEIPLTEPSILRVVAESKSYYAGPMPMTAANSTIIAALGGGTPLGNLLVPLMMMGRVVAILYVEGGTLRPDERVADLQRLLGKASMAFEILIMKNKILLT